LFNQLSNRGASSSKKAAFEIPHDKKPRRFASALMSLEYFSL
jgi:hypothetical protein